MDLPWERAVKIRLEPFMVLKGGEDLYSGMHLWLMLNPARFSVLLEGTGHNADELLALLKDGKPLPHFDLPWRLAATVDAKSPTSFPKTWSASCRDPTLRCAPSTWC